MAGQSVVGMNEEMLTREEVRTPTAAAVAGIIFALVLIAALILIRLGEPSTVSQAATFRNDSTRKFAVGLALGLIPFAGVAFLWFIGVIRDRMGAAEDRLFATVFLGSGLLFVGMLFVAAATAAGVMGVAAGLHGELGKEVWTFGRSVSSSIANIYAMRMAAVFTISTSTILLRGQLMPKWLAYVGYVIAVILLVGVGILAWVELLFPVWVFVVSVYIIIESSKQGKPRLSVASTT
jgi:hypothetical protein